jgi:hypothetical protein
MNAQLVYILASIAAEQARVAAMQAENQWRERQGQAPAYGEDAFLIVAGRLDELTVEARNAG